LVLPAPLSWFCGRVFRGQGCDQRLRENRLKKQRLKKQRLKKQMLKKHRLKEQMLKKQRPNEQRLPLGWHADAC
jgi:hypothetical protein